MFQFVSYCKPCRYGEGVMSVSVCFSLQALLVWLGSNEYFSLFLTASLAGMARE